MAKKPTQTISVETIIHDEAKRKNIPTAEHQSVVHANERQSKKIKYPRNTDIDPQLVWRGKDDQDWSDLVVNAPPLYIQEKVHPKALIDDLVKQTKEDESKSGMVTPDLFSDFDSLLKDADKTEFYSHDQNWSNRMILGDSLQVMASLAEREGLKGQVQCVYFDPPYGIKFNSNFQWSTTTRDVKDGSVTHITREPEQVKAFRDTWKDGIHSYLTYIRDRLTVARDLLTESGSIFVQIGDENVHKVRSVLDEVFGEENFVSEIVVVKTSGLGANLLPRQNDFIIWYAKKIDSLKYRQLYTLKTSVDDGASAYQMARAKDGTVRRLSKDEIANLTETIRDTDVCAVGDLTKPGPGSKYEFSYNGRNFQPGNRWWGVPKSSLERVAKSGRLYAPASNLGYLRFLSDWQGMPITNIWTDTGAGGMNKIYVVQTPEKIVQRCILMCSDPGDLVLDPTCGSGTSAVVSEQWGRRWITIDTSRVALALARIRIMGAKFPYYLLADSREGQIKESEITHTSPSSQNIHGNIRHGFVCERVPHITLKSIANNAEIDVIHDKWKEVINSLRSQLNTLLNKSWEDWEIPIQAQSGWSEDAKEIHTAWLQSRISRQNEIDCSIVAKADFEYLFDKPYENKKAVRVAGPFTVESLSPHRALGVDENGNLIDPHSNISDELNSSDLFTKIILENLKNAGVQQSNIGDRISFVSLTPWPGNLICAEGRYTEGSSLDEKRAAIFIGPEFGTVQRTDLVEAAKEAGDAGFDTLIACAFNYEAHATEFNKLGRIPVLKARMNADLHMAEDLKNTGKGNLFVIFGEPDIEINFENDDHLSVKVNGVDVFKPQTGEVISDGADGIACWFIDTDYNGESFFVRQAYFLGANDPYSSLKVTLKSEINAEAWATLNSDKSRIFPKPKSGRIAVKVINHLGDEVMKVFKV